MVHETPRKIQMEQYENQGRDSGVSAYEISPCRIIVQFQDGSIYEYTDRSAGPDKIQRMHRLAETGEGLNEFINRSARKAYAAKLR